MLSADLDELVLTPDALLEIEGAEGDGVARIASQQLRTVSLERDEDWYVLEANESRIALAVRPDSMVQGSGRTPEVRLAIELESGWSLDVSWQPTSGRHDEWIIPANFAGELATAPLLVEAESSGWPAAGGTGFRWELFSPAVAGAPNRAIELTLGWGRVVASREIGLGEPERKETADAACVFERAGIGSVYVVTCISQDLSLLGRTEFVFQGQTVAVDVVQNSFATLQLVDAASDVPLAGLAARFDLYFGDRDCLDGLCVWNDYVTAVTGEDGSSTFCLNPKVAIQAGAAFPPPDAARVKVTVEGFEPSFVDVVRNGARGEIDLGVVPMMPLQPALIVSAPGQVYEGYRLLISGTRGESLFAVESRAIAIDGRQLIGVFTTEDTDEAALTDEIATAESQGAGMLLVTEDDRIRGVVREGTAWTPVPSQLWELDLLDARPDGSTGRVEIGIRWRSTDHRLGWMRPEVGTRWAFEAPASGLSLWSRTVVNGDRSAQKVEHAISQHARISVQ